MRTKLFIAFIAVILVALVSNLIYRDMIVRDFEDYVRGSKEDKLYWVLASVEGSYSEGRWNHAALHDALHWGMMLGFDLRIEDSSGKELVGSADIMAMLSGPMKRRMEGIVDLGSARGEYMPYPLFVGGSEIGTLYARELGRYGSIQEKETVFKERGKEFLLISFLIAGGGALFLAVIFVLFLSRPLKKMKQAVDAMADGDFSVRIRSGSRDEIGRLAGSFDFMAEALEREEALRSHLTSNIAHELRTPLTVMKAHTEAMIDGVVEDRTGGLDTLRIEIDKLIRLVEGIEDMTKAEASFFEKKEAHRIDLQEFLSSIVSKNALIASEKGLGLSLSSPGPLTVLTDPDKLERIVQNLVSNAIKYTDSGEVRIRFGSEKELYFIEVQDTGAGIPAEEHGLVFRRFYKSEKSGGIGLGLAIVNELVRTLGGSLALRSAPGEGSTFTVLLPRQGYGDTV